MRKTGDARMLQQDYQLLKSMEQEGSKLNNTDVKDNSDIIPVNPEGGVHQQGGAPSSGTIQGGEQDKGEKNKQDVPMEKDKGEQNNEDVLMETSTTTQRRTKQDDDKRMGKRMAE